MRDTFLFDLDGTLLPMDMDKFIELYFYEMSKHFHDMIDGRVLAKHIWNSTEATAKDLDPRPNEEKFMKYFAKALGIDDLTEYRRRFDHFYEERFDRVKKCVVEMPIVKESVDLLKEKGYNLVIATNPIFPIKAVHKRIEWAGLNVQDFSYISSYEKNNYCKPHLYFYNEVLDAIGKDPEECYMVGNDVQEDLIVEKIGMETFLITDFMINAGNQKIVSHHKGDYQDFYNFVKSLEVA
ncbi:MAG: HAD family hydrolase [Clostridiales bacterium]|nr:HAD family hydrolase [Clostridiales bacterium]